MAQYCRRLTLELWQSQMGRSWLSAVLLKTQVPLLSMVEIPRRQSGSMATPRFRGAVILSCRKALKITFSVTAPSLMSIIRSPEAETSATARLRFTMAE